MPQTRMAKPQTSKKMQANQMLTRGKKSFGAVENCAIVLLIQ